MNDTAQLTKDNSDSISGAAMRLMKIQRYINRMPSFSTTVSKVLEICSSVDASPSDLNRVISYDPVLTGQLIKLINSAYYGLPNRVTSLTRAIIMLGINTVKNIVLATSVLASFKGRLKIPGLTIDQFWIHSLAVAVIAKTIAKHQQVPSEAQEEYFVAGLMHDLGKIPLMNCYPHLYKQALDQTARGSSSLCRSEADGIGIDHCQVGYLIGAKWKLNDRVQNAIGNHHLPTQDNGATGTSMRCITGLANQLAKALVIGFAGDADIDPVLTRSFTEHLGIEFQSLSQMKSGIDREVEKAKIFLKVAE